MNDAKENEIKKDKYGRPIMGPNTGVKFSSTYQADPVAKSKGQYKRKAFRDLMESPLKKTKDNSKLIELAAKVLQVDEEQITIADLLHVAQIKKATQKADTFAYVAVMDRAFGKPENKTTIANDENNPITPLSADQVNLFINKIKAGGVGEGINVQTSNIEEAQVIENKEDKSSI